MVTCTTLYNHLWSIRAGDCDLFSFFNWLWSDRPILLISRAIMKVLQVTYETMLIYESTLNLKLSRSIMDLSMIRKADAPKVG
jgi:hypothetical protein